VKLEMIVCITYILFTKRYMEHTHFCTVINKRINRNDDILLLFVASVFIKHTLCLSAEELLRQTMIVDFTRLPSLSGVEIRSKPKLDFVVFGSHDEQSHEPLLAFPFERVVSSLVASFSIQISSPFLL